MTEESQFNHLGIDVKSVDANRLIRRLKRLKTTVSVADGGAYHADRNYSQVHLETSWTESELDKWLYGVNHGADYQGTFDRGQA